MSETNPNIEKEVAQEVTKEQLIAAYTKLREERNIHNPDDFDLQEPEVIRINNMYFSWIKSMDDKASSIGTQKAKLEADIVTTMFYVDAGFDDPDYLDEVASDFLENTLAAAEEITDEDVSDVIEQIHSAQAQIRAKLS
jgi:hypothetical protein